jgi:hypothetical protein
MPSSARMASGFLQAHVALRGFGMHEADSWSGISSGLEGPHQRNSVRAGTESSQDQVTGVRRYGMPLTATWSPR